MDMENYKYMLRVSCSTYNHAAYIEDAMNGFCMQETTFPFICTIIDDCSTDGEQEVIKRYLESNFDLENSAIFKKEENDDYLKIFACHKTNKNCFFAVFLLKYNHYSIKKAKRPYLRDLAECSKYMALCEGDDYWVSNDKLQRQVDFLESNPDYSLCFHGAKVKIEGSKIPEIKSLDNLECREYSAEEIYDNWTVPTASAVYRSFIKSETDKRFVYGDLVLFLSCSLVGKMFCIGDPLCVYRRHDNGMSTSNTSFKKIINHQLALRDHFPQLKKIIDIHVARKYVIFFFMGGLNRDSWDVCKHLITHPRYIIPVMKYLPSFFSSYLKKKSISSQNN